jgi:hypothetical protein
MSYEYAISNTNQLSLTYLDIFIHRSTIYTVNE